MVRQYYQRVDPEGVCLLHLTKRKLKQSNMIDEYRALAFGEINGKEVHPSRSFRAAVTRHGRRISCVFVKGRWVSPILHVHICPGVRVRIPLLTAGFILFPLCNWLTKESP